MWSLLKSILIFALVGGGGVLGVQWYQQKYYHRAAELNATVYDFLVNNSDMVGFEGILDKLLIPRVPGTANHTQVRQYISSFMSALGWDVEKDTFQDTTPMGTKEFENIVATLNPDVPRRLVLACHFDSKHFTTFPFVAATDSAVPCAQLMHLATVMKPFLDNHNTKRNVTLQIIFFDGEEAFQYWSATDSLYGSRHLAAKWEETPYPPGNTERTNMLHRMDMLVLLDLLGVAGPNLHNFYPQTNTWYNLLLQSEQELKRSGAWRGDHDHSIFNEGQQSGGGIEDDHIPFLKRGVSIVHLIASPFPPVWHQEGDNKGALDFPTIDNLNMVFRLFVARYLDGKEDPSSSSAVSSISQASQLSGVLEQWSKFLNTCLVFG